MGATNKSDAIQNSKHKAKFAAQLNQRTWETHKAVVAAKQKKIVAGIKARIAKRAELKKPERGTARTAKRLHLQREKLSA